MCFRNNLINIQNMSNTNNCVICEEKSNKTIHTPITCNFCNFEACRNCCETYLLSQTDAKCMNTACAKPWDRKFMVSAFPKSFMSNQWKKHREQVFLDKELALLPATQPIVEDRIRKEKIKKKIEEIDNLIRDLRIKQRELQYEMINPSNDQTRKSHFVRACADPDCRGYVSTQWKCGLCEKRSCKDCHVLIDINEQHICNPDELATAKLLDKDTKPCPSCQTGIFKIEGCDQMWCTQCKTAFSWRTGAIETVIHNPHFYEWQRRTGGEARRNPGDVVCGREITHEIIENLSRRLRISATANTRGVPVYRTPLSKTLYDRAYVIVRSIVHLRGVQLPDYRVGDNENNLDLRISYMRQEIDKDTFMQRIQRNNKKFEKNREIYNIISLFIQTVTDIMFRFQDEVNKSHIFASAKILEEIQAIQDYTNECLEDIAETYGNKSKKIEFYSLDSDRFDNNNVLV